jgi:hypothetical protein
MFRHKGCAILIAAMMAAVAAPASAREVVRYEMLLANWLRSWGRGGRSG